MGWEQLREINTDNRESQRRETPEEAPEWDGNNSEKSTLTTENPKDESEKIDQKPAPTTDGHSSKIRTDRVSSARSTGGKS